jgi:segregation and condensation protein B
MSNEHAPTLPFRVVVAPNSVTDADALASDAPGLAEETENWSLDDIEAAYQQALDSLDTLDATVADALGEPEPDAPEQPLAIGSISGEMAPAPSNSFFSSTPQEAPAPTVTSRQVLEALLFVGGMTLPSRKLADVLSGSTRSEDVLRLIDELNALYDAECRPYRIELAEGGYRLQLRSEFEKVRHRVYGFGPREVKLSQEVIEILSFIAYSQPVTEEELNGLGREGTSSVIRQLLRRELIQLTRGDQAQIQYETAPRFLELFGLRSMHDLPLPGDLAFK